MALSQISFDFGGEAPKKEAPEKTVKKTSPKKPDIREQIKPKSTRGRKSIKDYNAVPDAISCSGR